MRFPESVIAGLVLAVLALGIALLPLLTPAFTRALSARYSEYPNAASFAEASRQLVVSEDPAARERLLTVMQPDEVSHLDDVAGVISGARSTTLALALAAAAWIALCVRAGRAKAVARGLTVGGLLTLGLLALAGVAGTTDFDALFVRFHGLFFANGTWTFPVDSALISLFPEPFWMVSGVAWVLLTAGVGVFYLVSGRVVARRASD
ncbi:MAG TPA: DUF1461 domain-containing protein [Coriobacteriia bacterium]|nr:DUF1461 domain-containing protein [Coriobacteriia bacterium]